MTPVLAYGHYPLEVVTRSPYNPGPDKAGKSLRELLMHHNVSVYVAGHLHSAFGQKLHRLHGREGLSRC